MNLLHIIIHGELLSLALVEINTKTDIETRMFKGDHHTSHKDSDE